MSRAKKAAGLAYSRKVFVEDDPSVAVLMEEYKLHRAEAAENSAKNNRQVTYIQIYGLFLVAVAGSYYQFSDAFKGARIPDALTLPVLIIAASLLFYLYSQIYLSSFTFRVLRMRMAEIEQEINKRSKAKLLRYEQEVAPEFFGKPMIVSRYLSPNTWLQLFLVSLFVSAAYVVSGLALTLLSNRPTIALVFVGSTAFFAFALLWENFKLSRPGVLAFSSSPSPTPNVTKNLKLARYALNYFVVVFVVFIFAFDKVDYEASSYVLSWINHFFTALETMSKASVALLVSAYTALCGYFLPTPSELPLALVEPLGWGLVLLSSSIGKGLGAVALMSTSRLYFKVNDYSPGDFSSFVDGSVLSSIVSSQNADRAYFVCQSIPFLPMRSATVAYAAISDSGLRSYLVVAAGSAVGTVVRMLLMWLIISMGVAALPDFGVTS
ncbi:MAG: hypothetical protein NXI27_29660 [Alphaproteobacteria bacterium]|nr:hypothetical protein [Alphaproteobacteria bacterium]